MRTALVTTTINVPTVLALYRKLGPDVRFYVAGDIKTPPEAAMGSDAPHFMNVEYQKSLGYKCSELIGWNCIQRRNIAILEALKWGADIIVSIDDDNIPLDAAYFYSFEGCFTWPFNGIKVSSPAAGGWFDVGQLLDPIAPHRGFPHTVKSLWRADPVIDAKVGVAAGICLGDPDIGAVERIANHPTVHRVSELLRNGIVVDNQTWTVFNSQNTAFIRELAPAMFLFPGVGRYDDIYASLFTQRIMRELNYHVHFGQPFVWQQRNEHDLIKDLRNEIDGMANVLPLTRYLDATVLPFVKGAPVVDLYRYMLAGLHALPTVNSLLPKSATEAALAWCDDIEEVMG